VEDNSSVDGSSQNAKFIKPDDSYQSAPDVVELRVIADSFCGSIVVNGYLPANPDEALGAMKLINFIFRLSGRAVGLPRGFSANCNESAFTWAVASRATRGMNNAIR